MKYIIIASMGLLLSASMCMLLAGCGADPIQTADTHNSTSSASLIAIVDGCKLWKVNDGYAREVYFAHCQDGKAVGMDWIQSTGKSSHHVQTVGD